MIIFNVITSCPVDWLYSRPVDWQEKNYLELLHRQNYGVVVVYYWVTVFVFNCFCVRVHSYSAILVLNHYQFAGLAGSIAVGSSERNAVHIYTRRELRIANTERMLLRASSGCGIYKFALR